MKEKGGKYYVYVFSDLNEPGNFVVKGMRAGKKVVFYKFKYKPFYVGKGTGNRYLSHICGYSNGCDDVYVTITLKDVRLYAEFPFYSDDEYQAYYEESRIIRAFGLRPYGLLLNRNFGRF